MPVLICLTGLPGVGKTTIARSLANQTGALWLWIDRIETAMKLSQMEATDLADGGYAAAQAVATDALLQGYDVIADCVNPISYTRSTWRQVALDADAICIDVEVTCSDERKHQLRLEERTVELDGWVGPNWADVLTREYESLPDASLHLDTAELSIEQSVALIRAAICTETGAKKNARNR